MVDDELKPLLGRIEESDVIVLGGSPIYYENLSGQMRSFTDRYVGNITQHGCYRRLNTIGVGRKIM